MAKQKMTKNLKLALMGLVVAAATLLALPLDTNQAHAAAPPEKRDFFGTVVAVVVDVIQVSLTDGTIVDVTVTEDTAIRLPRKEDAQLTDLFEGDMLAVSMTSDEPATAAKIFVIPGKTQFRHVPGEITSVGVDSITLQPLATGSDALVFEIAPGTKIKFRAGATELVEGVFAVVLTRRNALTGELSPNALEIHVSAGRSRTRPVETRPVAPETRPEFENEAKVTGVFEGLDEAGNWIVNGKTVTTDADTEIDSGIVVGQVLRVEGTLQADGSLLAKEIEARGVSRQGRSRARIEGVFEGLDNDGNWIVSGTIVVITDDTDTDGEPFIGQRVLVVGIVHDRQTLIAREVENIVSPDRSGASEENRSDVKLEGIFEGVNHNGDWIVNGVEISLDHVTRLEGTPEVGSTVEIKGVLRAGKIVALRIEVEDVSENSRGRYQNRVTLRGLIDAISDDGTVISVASHRIHISDLTEVDGDIVLGIGVKILAIILDDGTLVAREIDVRERGGDDREFGPLDMDGTADDDSNRIDGVIELVNDDGSFVVAGITIVVPERLAAGRVLTEGLEIRVYGVFQDDGSLLAGRIRGGEANEDYRDDEERIRGRIDEVIIEGDIVVAIVVDGRTIHTAALTEIDSPLRPGVQVKVEVIVTDRGLVAREIDQDRRGRRDGAASDEARDRRGPDQLRELEGIVSAFSDSRVVLTNGRTVAINSDTRIDGSLFIGAEVEIKLVVVDNGLLVAKRIEVSRPNNDRPTVGSSEAAGANNKDDADVAESDDEEDEDETDADEEEQDSRHDVKVKLDGKVSRFSSTRLILQDGTRLLINRGTDIDAKLFEGAEVEIKAVRRKDGTLVAEEIDVEEPRDEKDRSGNSGSGSSDDDDDDDGY